MLALQLPCCRALALNRSPKPSSFSSLASSFWGSQVSFFADEKSSRGLVKKVKRRRIDVVLAMDSSSFKMNLNEYMVTLEKPLGIRFALSVNGKIFVHALKKGVFLLKFNGFVGLCLNPEKFLSFCCVEGKC